MKTLFNSIALISILVISTSSWAARGGGGGSGGHSMQFSLSLTNASQDDTNGWIDSHSLVGTKNLGAGYEFLFDYEYKYSGTMFALKFRPSYFTQSADGGGVKAEYTGFTFFPILRMYPLENSFMKFFLQVGVGYGALTGKWSDSTGSIEFKGDNFGGLAGLGAEFCFAPAHCMTIEGNLRYLPFQRNVATGTGSVGGNLTGAPVSSGSEVETNNSDAKTTLSGLQGILAYHLYF